MLYASADPLDISFRICLKAIEDWINNAIVERTGILDEEPSEVMTDTRRVEIATKMLASGFLEELVLLVVDDCDKRIKDSLYKTFRSLRPARPKFGKSALVHFHDDMYFGDSRYSIGIQLADLCSYFIARHIEGDKEVDRFYEQIAPHIIYYEHYPQHEDAMVEVKARLKAERAAFYGTKPEKLTDGAK